jgi:GT2 family glycosyltransferase
MFNNKVLIICTTFNFPKELAKTLPCILKVLNNRPDTYCTIIDNLSKDKETHKLLDAAHHNQLTIIKKDVNYGKGHATNDYLTQTLSKENCPRILISMDPDMVFDPNSFNYLVNALDTVPKLGMLGMRYLDNEYNPERSLWWPAKKIKIQNKTFQIKCPVFANVAGGFFGVQGEVLSHCLNFQLFPRSKNVENIKKGYVKRGESVDAYLYDYLKKFRLIQGYLEGTQIEHLKSPPQTEGYIK